jgi:UbiD family decarboxylase
MASKAVLFEKVRGSKIRVACNIIATPRRFYLALGGSSHKSHEEDVKKNIHSRVNEALHALSEPTRTEGGGLFEETHPQAYTTFL